MRGAVSRPAPINLADDGAWCLAGAVPGERLIVEPRLLLWTGGCSAGRADIDRLLELVSWHCGAATQRAGVDRQIVRASGRCHSSLRVHLSSKLRLSVRPYLLRMGETGWRGGGRRTYPVPFRGPNQGRQ